MSERIKRYDFVERDGEYESDTGPYCRSTDVAALEAENARLRRIVEAGDKMQAAIREGGSDTRMRECARAYDAAKAQATQQGEKKP